MKGYVDAHNGVLTIQKNGADIGTFSANQETNETINIVVPDALPVGTYIQFAGSQAPAGFLVCNGGEISRTTYSALFSVIGTTYGSGDGSTTFNLPNLTDRFLQGSTTSGTYKGAGLPDITSSVQFSPFDAQNGRRSIIVNATGAMTLSDATTNAEGIQKQATHEAKRYQLNFNASKSSSIYGNSATVQPPALTCLICIKY